MASNRSYHAIVQKVVSGKHGPYAVARSEELGFITFSLDAKVWREGDLPEPGTCVVLSEVRKKRAGWRAMSARFFEPADEEEQKKEKKGGERNEE